MSGFASSWLALRASADKKARNKKVRDEAISSLPSTGARILDLASGTGSTLRALSPDISGRQGWHLVDRDEALMDLIDNPDPDRISVTTEKADLSSDLTNVLGHVFPGGKVADLVTTSAFLDLVSERWIKALVDLLDEDGQSFYSALTYDGRMTFAPEHPLDATIRQTLNGDQKTDKGFGTALGPDVHDALVKTLKARDFSIVEGQSDWDLGGDEDRLQSTFVDGLFELAAKVKAATPSSLEDWRDTRKSAIGYGQSRIVVGHRDLFAAQKR